MPDDQRLSDLIFDLLLYLYPRSFRDAYGQQMRIAFRDYARAAKRRGRVLGLVELWGVTLVDVLATALEERIRQMISTRSTLSAWAGPLTVVVGVLWSMSALGDLALRMPFIGDDSLVGLVAIPFFLSFIPLLPALLGTSQLLWTLIGPTGRLGLTLSILGCVGVFAALIVGSLTNQAPGDQPTLPGYGAFIGFTAIRLGYLFVGIDCLTSRPMQRWNGLPLLLGSSAVLSLPFDWFGVPALLPALAISPFWHFCLSGACWILVGVTMPGRREQAKPIVGA